MVANVWLFGNANDIAANLPAFFVPKSQKAEFIIGDGGIGEIVAVILLEESFGRVVNFWGGTEGNEQKMVSGLGVADIFGDGFVVGGQVVKRHRARGDGGEGSMLSGAAA